MANKSNTPKSDSVLKVGNMELVLKKYIEVAGHKVTCEYYLPAYQKTVKDYLAVVLNSFEKSASQEQVAYAVQVVQHNARYVPLELPLPLQNDQGIFFLGKPLPKWDIAFDLWVKVKSLNPNDHSREGNNHQVLFDNGGQTSIGSFVLMCLGIPQSRIAPSGGIAGTYHPARFLEVLAKLPGSKAKIESMSPMYDKARNLFNAKLAVVKPSKKSKK